VLIDHPGVIGAVRELIGGADVRIEAIFSDHRQQVRAAAP
jgi:hypothetical protein